MATLKEQALNYEAPTTKNIAELNRVPVDIEIRDDSFQVKDQKTGEDKSVKQKVISVEGEDYRVPMSVLRDLKVILNDNPKVRFFKVKKEGSAMSTRYTVIPLAE